jgi:hypothetical protein
VYIEIWWGERKDGHLKEGRRKWEINVKKWVVNMGGGWMCFTARKMKLGY